MYYQISLLTVAHLLWPITNVMLVRAKTEIRLVTRDPYAPEPKAALRTPDRNSDQWRNLKTGAEHVGLLFAGKNEFNWIVDIRIDNVDQELWAVGNLITNKKVLTTCRSSEVLKNHWTARDDFRIYFATHYLWETHVRKAKGGDLFDSLGVSGKRWVTAVKLHPNCHLKETVMWDTSIIELQRDVIPYFPGVGFIFITTVNPYTEQVDVELSKKERKLCYVASYGRKYYNVDKAKTIDHKVKYRVYIVDGEVCFSALKFMCGEKRDESCKVENYKKDDARQLMCFESRAKVGSVCDHDRGAPIICDDQLSGMVTRGADLQHCNNLLHVPFFVLKLDNFSEYFGSIFGKHPERAVYIQSSSNHLDDPFLFLSFMFIFLSLHLTQ